MSFTKYDALFFLEPNFLCSSQARETNKELYESLLADCKSRQGQTRGLLFGTLCVIRTNRFREFLADFTLPTFIDHALRVENVGLRIIALIAATCIDSSTFILRVMTLGPRYYVNSQQPRELHPIYQYLNEKKIVRPHDDRVFVVLRKPGDTSETQFRMLVNFVETPDNWSLNNIPPETRKLLKV